MALMLHEVAEIFAAQHAEVGTTPTRHAAKLPVQQRGLAIFAHQHIGLFGQVIMGDSGAVASGQKRTGLVKEFHVLGRRQLQWLTRNPTAQQHSMLPGKQPRKGLPRQMRKASLQALQGARLTPSQHIGEWAAPPSRLARVAAHTSSLATIAAVDCAEEVGLQSRPTFLLRLTLHLRAC